MAATCASSKLSGSKAYTIGTRFGFKPFRNFLTCTSSGSASVGSTFWSNRLNSSMYSSTVFRPCLRLSNWLCHPAFLASFMNFARNSVVKAFTAPVHGVFLRMVA